MRPRLACLAAAALLPLVAAAQQFAITATTVKARAMNVRPDARSSSIVAIDFSSMIG